MGQSPSSCLGASGVVADRPRSGATFRPYKSKQSRSSASDRQQNSEEIGTKDEHATHDIDASPTQSAAPTISCTIDGPPTPDLYADPPPATAVPPTRPILGGISRQGATKCKQSNKNMVGRLMHRSRRNECSHQRSDDGMVKSKSRQSLLSCVRGRRGGSSGDVSHVDLSVHQGNDGDRSTSGKFGAENGGGMIKLLSATAEDEDDIPIPPADVSMPTGEHDKDTPSSSAKRSFSPRTSSRRARSIASKTSLAVPVPTKTQLFRRDPLVLEQYGLDLADETTVAGTQIYAARVAAVDDQSRKIEGDASTPNAKSPLNSSEEDAVSTDPTSPHSSENQDETSLLLLPSSVDSLQQSPTRSSKESNHRRFRLFGRSTRQKQPMDPNDCICSCTYYGCQYGPHPNSQCMMGLPHKMETPRRYRETNIPAYPKGCASFLFTREAVRNNTADPVSDIVCISEEHRIYVADIGLTSIDCRSIIGVAERCSRGTWAAYTYAKQTLGCREYDDLASVCVSPVMTATATIMETFEEPYNDSDEEEADIENESDEDSDGDGSSFSHQDGEDRRVAAVAVHGPPPMEERRPDSAPQPRPRYKRQLVLDDREPHLVKYDLTRKERQKLDTHTDKSEWTFLISLSEGCGAEYSGGGTYFECIDSTVHLSRGHALIFPGKLRHRGQKIISGRRFLLVGFLVDKNEGAKKMTTTSLQKNISSTKS